MGPTVKHNSLDSEGSFPAESENDVMADESERCSTAGFKDAGGGSHVKGCGWPLEAEKAKITDSPPEPPEKNTALTLDQWDLC